MTIQKAIKKAEDSGYFWESNCEFVCDESHLMNSDFWRCLGKAMNWEGGKIRMCGGCGVALRCNENPTMDGKHGGKSGCGSDIDEYEGQWLIEWHRFIDYLAEGKTIKSFFRNLN